MPRPRSFNSSARSLVAITSTASLFTDAVLVTVILTRAPARSITGGSFRVRATVWALLRVIVPLTVPNTPVPKQLLPHAKPANATQTHTRDHILMKSR